MKTYKPPTSINQRNRTQKSIFLAGSIENGQAIDWQKECEALLESSFEIFNPRRDNWDSSWTPELENPNFYQQVDWEINALEKADYILFFFAPMTKSPISLLELGLFASSKKVIVVCPKDFWRKGNVDYICQKFDIPQFENLKKATKYLKTKAFSDLWKQ